MKKKKKSEAMNAALAPQKQTDGKLGNYLEINYPFTLPSLSLITAWTPEDAFQANLFIQI